LGPGIRRRIVAFNGVESAAGRAIPADDIDDAILDRSSGVLPCGWHSGFRGPRVRLWVVSPHRVRLGGSVNGSTENVKVVLDDCDGCAKDRRGHGCSGAPR